jgi:hypothetical protein
MGTQFCGWVNPPALRRLTSGCIQLPGRILRGISQEQRIPGETHLTEREWVRYGR